MTEQLKNLLPSVAFIAQNEVHAILANPADKESKIKLCKILINSLPHALRYRTLEAALQSKSMPIGIPNPWKLCWVIAVLQILSVEEIIQGIESHICVEPRDILSHSLIQLYHRESPVELLPALTDFLMQNVHGEAKIEENANSRREGGDSLEIVVGALKVLSQLRTMSYLGEYPPCPTISRVRLTTLATGPDDLVEKILQTVQESVDGNILQLKFSQVLFIEVPSPGMNLNQLDMELAHNLQDERQKLHSTSYLVHIPSARHYVALKKIDMVWYLLDDAKVHIIGDDHLRTFCQSGKLPYIVERCEFRGLVFAVTTQGLDNTLLETEASVYEESTKTNTVTETYESMNVGTDVGNDNSEAEGTQNVSLNDSEAMPGAKRDCLRCRHCSITFKKKAGLTTHEKYCKEKVHSDSE